MNIGNVGWMSICHFQPWRLKFGIIWDREIAVNICRLQYTPPGNFTTDDNAGKKLSPGNGKEKGHMKRTVIVAVAALLLFGTGLWGCGGGGANVKNQITTTSLGQELTDLDQAYKQGIITDKEYEKAKNGLMKRFK
jgi:hypothetical protein